MRVVHRRAKRLAFSGAKDSLMDVTDSGPAFASLGKRHSGHQKHVDVDDWLAAIPGTAVLPTCSMADAMLSSAPAIRSRRKRKSLRQPGS
jgi:hypothetical protein